LAELLGGRIEVEGAPRVGSTFTLTIPRVYRGPAEVALVPEVTPRLDPMRLPVLVVEDNAETLFIYEKYLKGTGFQVAPARTVAAARRMVQTVRPCAVVLDILLEGENGWDLIGELKRQPTMRGVPVWVVTVVDNRHKARALGADDFCMKPVERAWLLEKLHALVRPEGREKLLLIDDEEASRYLLKGLLADSRFEIVEAASGVEGLRLAEREQPRAIFLDLEMPDVNGVDVLRSLRAIEATRSIPVIVHTSKVLTVAERQSLAQQTAAILSKEAPSRAEALARLRQALMQAGLSADPAEARHD
jgi:CheY-like chemotaxis protein